MDQNGDFPVRSVTVYQRVFRPHQALGPLGPRMSSDSLRFARESDIEDLGLVSEIYRRLYNCGFNPDEEKIFLVPGKGWGMTC